MIVVSDTSPLTALLTVGEIHILRELFGEVVIPGAVETELRRSHAVIPDWIRVQIVQNRSEVARFMQSVDLGEAEAIVLAEQLHADYLLMDERKGRRLAVQEGLSVIGLLGAVILARKRQLIPSARALLERLEREAGVYLAGNSQESDSAWRGYPGASQQLACAVDGAMITSGANTPTGGRGRAGGWSPSRPPTNVQQSGPPGERDADSDTAG